MKQEWPHNWTTFVSDVVGASKTSESLCTNNMTILKLLRFPLYGYGYVSISVWCKKYVYLPTSSGKVIMLDLGQFTTEMCTEIQ